MGVGGHNFFIILKIRRVLGFKGRIGSRNWFTFQGLEGVNGLGKPEGFLFPKLRPRLGYIPGVFEFQLWGWLIIPGGIISIWGGRFFPLKLWS